MSIWTDLTVAANRPGTGTLRAWNGFHREASICGSKPIAAPVALREDSIGAYYEAEMLDAGYANELLPALQAGQLGASFRFRVTDQEWDDRPARSAHNPDGLRERTIHGVQLFEVGPCTFGAYPAATAGIKNLSTLAAFKPLALT